MTKRWLLAGCATLVLGGMGFSSTPADAAKLNGEVLFELQNDWVYESDDPDADVNTMYTTIEPYVVLTLNEHLSLIGSFVFEPVQDHDPNDSTFFDNEGLYVSELKAEFAVGDFTFYGGKFNPVFGTAWDITPGIYGTEIAEDYEIAEMIGGGAAYGFDGGTTGQHTVNLATYFADTTPLVQSAITDRGDLSIRDGGNTNTEDFSSFALALDSENAVGIEGFNTHLALRRHAAGDYDPAGSNAEMGYAAGASYTMPLSDSTELALNGEYVRLNNEAGGSDTLDYYTFGAALAFLENWNAAMSYSNMHFDSTTGPNSDTHLYQTSLGYAFENGLALDVGYRFVDEDGVDSHTVGALLSYAYDFDVNFGGP